jgi:hypothetical protein
MARADGPIFDSKSTTYSNLSVLNRMGIEFITLRRRSRKLLEEIARTPVSAWRRIELESVSRAFRTPRILDRQITLSGYEGLLRQLTIAELGHESPTVLLTNQFRRSPSHLIGRYAQRMLIENNISACDAVIIDPAGSRQGRGFRPLLLAGSLFSASSTAARNGTALPLRGRSESNGVLSPRRSPGSGDTKTNSGDTVAGSCLGFPLRIPGTPYPVLASASGSKWLPTMAPLARVVAPAIPHHITRRGNRRQQTLFCEEDDQCYPELMAQFCRPEQVEIWTFYLRGHEHTGRPLGDEAFLASLEQNLGRILTRQKHGPKGELPS